MAMPQKAVKNDSAGHFTGSPLRYRSFLDPYNTATPQDHDSQNSLLDPPESVEVSEDRHFHGVCEALSHYSVDALHEVARMEYHFHGLSEDDKSLLIEDIASRTNHMKRCVMANQQFLNLLLLETSSHHDLQDPHDGCTARAPDELSQSDVTRVHKCVDTPQVSEEHHFGTPSQEEDKAFEAMHHTANHVEDSLPQESKEAELLKTSPLIQTPTHFSCGDLPESIRQTNISKVRSTLRQFVRDWSQDGKVERDAAYQPLLEDLESILPLKPFMDKHKRLPRVLCPGSGLGRLPFEVAKRGYGCQGNEFSFFMLLGSNLILNSKIPVNSLVIYPYCLSTSNRVGHRDHVVQVRLPDVCPVDSIQPGHDFSMCAGEFVEVYWEQEKQWDAILTCFFIDTAKNILLYIRTIARILPQGGLWANLGPLLYHFSDVSNEISIELSYQEIRHVILKYFTILKESWCYALYTVNPASMMHVRYNCIHFVAIRNGTPMTGISNSVY